MLRMRKENLREHDGGRALRRHRDRADLRERRAGDELDRVDRALGGDAHARKNPQRRGVAGVLDRGDRGQVELPVEQQAVQLGRDAPGTSSTSALSRWKTGAMFT